MTYRKQQKPARRPEAPVGSIDRRNAYPKDRDAERGSGSEAREPGARQRATPCTALLAGRHAGLRWRNAERSDRWSFAPKLFGSLNLPIQH